MGRKKSRPSRARGPGAAAVEPDTPSPSSSASKLNRSAEGEARKDVCVEVDSRGCAGGDHRDLAELVIRNVRINGEGKESVDFAALGEEYLKNRGEFSLRLRVLDAPREGFRLGQWPVVPSDCVLLECHMEKYSDSVFISGNFDGPDEGVSGLAHSVSLRLVTLRIVGFAFLRGDSVLATSLRVRLEVMDQAFSACESLLEVTRHPWRKSFMNMMSWVRPEVMTSAAIYGIDGLVSPVDGGADGDFAPKSDSQFDLAAFYEAVKPSSKAELLNEELPDLLPHLRPYQLRAANWMVQREKGNTMVSSRNQECLSVPYCVPIDFIGNKSRMFYNPFNGNVSLQPVPSPHHVSGGILADEMGLGKTVELLACIFSHRRAFSEDCSLSPDVKEIDRINRQKRDRVECICGAASETSSYEGMWIQCDTCDAWQHADCVGYSLKKDLPFDDVTASDSEKGTMKSKVRRQKIGKYSVAETDEKYICPLCLELTETAQTTIFSHATLIVCPSPILAQWHSEIARHTRSGSLKVRIYEGAKNLDSVSTQQRDISEMSSADIVLTTYDVLKEDLSHDSDRHDGDRHFLRFQKRYPVIPTVLTRVHWWRLCLDEAQMVESSKTSVTEMAMRLNAQHRWCITGTPIQLKFDDLFGLLRFLRTSPFDTYRWWVDIIKDPYERGDKIAMNYAHQFFREIMWRSSKAHVSGELQLPPQEECFSWLTFSSIEEYFYQKQHATCMNRAHDIIRRLRNGAGGKDPNPDSKALSNVYLSNDDTAKLLVPLLKLRQACCHPQVGSSGLCSLQHTPLSMDEILQVLIGKAKIEGEEELRKIVVALNGLAALAVIEQKNEEAISLYKEALEWARENFDDFRVDPLLNLHINHNIAELLRTSSEYLQECPLKGQPLEVDNRRKRKETSPLDLDLCRIKRIKRFDNRGLVLTANGHEEDKNIVSKVCTSGEVDVENLAGCHSSSECFADGCLRETCHEITEKYLSVFTSKLLIAQKDFSASFKEVLTLYTELQNKGTDWWLHALDCIAKNKDSASEFIRKIDSSSTKSTTGLGSAGTSSSVQTIAGLKYTILAGIDSLQRSREQLMARLLEVDKTMDNPKDEDIEGQRYCPNCYDGSGSLCIQCELDRLFQGYEARLFLVKKSNNDSVIASVEEAQDLQRRKYELNHFFRTKKSNDNEGSEPGDDDNNPRFARENIQVYRHPSRTETALRVIRSHARTILGKQYLEIAKKHLLLFEAMRKEFSLARSLSIAQNQLLRAHDEIKMSISRLQLKENDDEPSAVNIVSMEELESYKVQFTSDKFLSQSSLARMRGQLRYLKGLVNKKTPRKNGEAPPNSGNTVATETSFLATGQTVSDTSNEPCPVCHDKFFDQKMVLQCGHFMCCKCCIGLAELAAKRSRGRRKWIMCPTCRQCTDLENVAFVVENQGENAEKQAEDLAERTISVQGSYGTKVEAVTRRILRITSTDEEAKILVFSSWNDVLDVLEHSLAANSISYARMKGGRKSQAALSQFKGQASKINGEKVTKKMQPMQVLLMLIQHGANGLNLLEAQHVILVEPLLNPAAEAQAISRIHRVGQDKSTFIHHFIVKKTIEEGIYKFNRGRAVCSTINRKSKNFKDELALTLKDVESLFPVVAPDEPPEQENESSGEILRTLPPSVAAGLAAERRLLMELHDNEQ